MEGHALANDDVVLTAAATHRFPMIQIILNPPKYSDFFVKIGMYED